MSPAGSWLQPPVSLEPVWMLLRRSRPTKWNSIRSLADLVSTRGGLKPKPLTRHYTRGWLRQSRFSKSIGNTGQTSLCVPCGLLLKNPRTVVPTSLQRRMLALLNEGHQGITPSTAKSKTPSPAAPRHKSNVQNPEWLESCRVFLGRRLGPTSPT